MCPEGCTVHAEDARLIGRQHTDRRIHKLMLTAGHLIRREAYTCWSTASSARDNNYGTRIDLILAAGGVASPAFPARFAACDISADATGSDHAPVWAELAPGVASRPGVMT